MTTTTASACAVALMILTRLAVGSPNVELDDPRYDELATYQARGLLPLYRGGVGQLTEARVRRLLVRAALPRGGWLRLQRGLLRLAIEGDRPRPYSTAALRRPVAGAIALSCEHTLGRPCDGVGSLGEVDGSIGYADFVSGTIRLRGNLGTQGYGQSLAVDRLYVRGQLGPVAFELGRDVLVLGPRSRTQLGWGDHAPALDQVRIESLEPVLLSGSLRASAQYAVARLRNPQTYTGGLLTLSRVQLDIAERLELGIQQALMLGGDGASIGGPVEFLLEHVRRRDVIGEGDSSNRRFGGDASWFLPAFRGLRLYYQVMFEDIRRKRLADAIRYDADHLIGGELAALGRSAVTVEYHQTGVRSYEHFARTTGFTNGGRIGGSPLGSDAKSFYVGARVTHNQITISPWIERAYFSSDEYSIEEFGGITLVRAGRRELRSRIGAAVRMPVGEGFSLEASTWVEHVSNFGFQRGTTRWNGRIALDLVWRNPN